MLNFQGVNRAAWKKNMEKTEDFPIAPSLGLGKTKFCSLFTPVPAVCGCGLLPRGWVTCEQR